MQITRTEAVAIAVGFVVSAAAVVGMYGWTGKSVIWMIGFFVLMLIVENLPSSSTRWRLIRIASALGILLGAAVVIYAV